MKIRKHLDSFFLVTDCTEGILQGIQRLTGWGFLLKKHFNRYETS